MDPIKHWVNLKRDNINYVNSDGIDSEEQIEYRLFECEFKKAKAAGFKVKIVPVKKGSSKYKNDEKNRNANFRLRKLGVTISEGDGAKTKLERKVFFPAAGGNKYKIEAKYKNKVIESKNVIEVWRRIYFQVISMDGVSIAPINKFVNAFKKHFIEMIDINSAAGKDKLNKANTIYSPAPRQGGGSNRDAILAEAGSFYKLQNFEPNAAAALFVKSIASYKEHEEISSEGEVPSVWDNMNGENKKIFKISLTNKHNQPLYLWKDIMLENDDANYWKISAALVKDDGTKLPLSKSTISIDESSCYRIVGAKKYGFDKLNIEVDPEDIGAWIDAQKIFVEIKVRIVNGFSGGFSLNDKNVVFVATRAWWDQNDTKPEELLYILSHEMGHKIGMVSAGNSTDPGRLPNGTKCFAWIDRKSPNAPPNLYGQYYEGRLANNQGHQGPHCEKGASYNTNNNSWSGSPDCVMFGATAMLDTSTNAYKSSSTEFCEECGKAVKKLDLDGDNLPGLKNRFF